jgi:16S rRNA (cytosine1402-N4)-methyltransferase
VSGHIPVMLAEVLEALAVRPGGTYVDATFGAGGYSTGILEKNASVIAFDRDPTVAATAQQLKARFPASFAWHAVPFGRMADFLTPASCDGAAFDLGVSSMQLDTPERGFSFRFDAPLDMRMSRQGATAADLVNGMREAELATIIRDYGEERCARRIAKAICHRRNEQPIATTGALAEVVRQVVPRSKDGIDPATRTFQALRIAVNDELGELERGLDAAATVLKPGGRLAVVSFHSLEDGLVKRRLDAQAHTITSRLLPGEIPPAAPLWRWVAKKPLVASDGEVSSNPRSRSARLRVAERLSFPSTSTLH